MRNWSYLYNSNKYLTGNISSIPGYIAVDMQSGSDWGVSFFANHTWQSQWLSTEAIMKWSVNESINGFVLKIKIQD